MCKRFFESKNNKVQSMVEGIVQAKADREAKENKELIERVEFAYKYRRLG